MSFFFFSKITPEFIDYGPLKNMPPLVDRKVKKCLVNSNCKFIIVYYENASITLLNSKNIKKNL
jgi:hypothetical protein